MSSERKVANHGVADVVMCTDTVLVRRRNPFNVADIDDVHVVLFDS